MPSTPTSVNLQEREREEKEKLTASVEAFSIAESFEALD
jgi:hypothetical protein